MTLTTNRPAVKSFREHIAVFGGAFDPPHLGHVDVAKGLLKNPSVKSVLIVPSYGTPLKTGVTSYEHRLEMARAAFTGIDRHIEVSDIEREIKCEFAWQLIERLKSLHEKIAFVIGTDQIAKLPEWGRYPQVLEMCDWIVLERQGAPNRTPLPDNMVRVHTQALQVSSTQVREQLALGHKDEIKSLLPRSVREYIERHQIYG